MTVMMKDTPFQQVSNMLSLLNGQRDLYHQLKALSEQQTRCIREGSTEQLLSVLSERQAVIEALSRSNAELAPYRDKWGELTATADPRQRQQVRETLDEIERVLKEVVEQDERDRVELKGAQQQIGAQLTQVNKAGRAISAYGPPQTRPHVPTFTDKQG